MYAALYVFERGRMHLDGFIIAAVAFVPAMASFPVTIVVGIVVPNAMLLWFLPLLTLLIVTFITMRKLLDLSMSKSYAHTGVVLAVNVLISMLAAAGSV